MLGRVLLIAAFACLPFNVLNAASFDENWKRCIDEKEIPNVAIRACTDSIESGLLNNEWLADAFFRRGIQESRKGAPKEAISDLTQAIKIKAGFADAYYNRGLVYSRAGLNDKAIADFNDAIRIKPELAGAFYSRGVSYYYKQDYKRAIANETLAITLKPDFAEAYINRCHFRVKLGKLGLALEDCAVALRLQPGAPSALWNRGFIHLSLEYFDEKITHFESALEDFNAVLEHHSGWASALYGRSLALRATGAIAAADMDLEAAKQLYPNIEAEYAERSEEFDFLNNAAGTVKRSPIDLLPKLPIASMVLGTIPSLDLLLVRDK